MTATEATSKKDHDNESISSTLKVPTDQRTVATFPRYGWGSNRTLHCESRTVLFLTHTARHRILPKAMADEVLNDFLIKFKPIGYVCNRLWIDIHYGDPKHVGLSSFLKQLLTSAYEF